MTGSVETFQFQAETKQLLDIVIHSLYSQKEIFLRELISNASDALDRVRLEALTNHDLLAADETLEIRLATDSNARTLSIEDNGVGMTRAEVAENIRRNFGMRTSGQSRSPELVSLSNGFNRLNRVMQHNSSANSELAFIQSLWWLTVSR